VDQRINLAEMSIADLQAHLEAVKQAIQTRKEADKAVAKRAVADKAKELGFSLEELFGTRKPRAAKEQSADGRASVEPKYAHPENASVTWTGRGKPPKWVSEYEANGKSRDDLLIGR
jgi:DNA-binding protein H-NS